MEFDARKLRFLLQDRARHFVGEVMDPRAHADWLLQIDVLIAYQVNPRKLMAVRTATQMTHYADMLVAAIDIDDMAHTEGVAEVLVGMECEFLELYAPYILDPDANPPYPPVDCEQFAGELDWERIADKASRFAVLPLSTRCMFEALVSFCTNFFHEDVAETATEARA